MTRRGIGLLGVLSSAGAHWPGQEKAPRTLREAGLVGGWGPRVSWRRITRPFRPLASGRTRGVTRRASTP